MKSLRGTIAVSLMALLAGTVAAQAQQFRPIKAGTQVRYDGWNGDGAPRPPGMWRGHGGTMWADHYRACRQRYGARYENRSDMVGHGRSARRCAL